MKIGFVTAMFGDLDFDRVIEIAHKEQYASIEVMCWPLGKAKRRYAGVTHIDVNDLSQSKLEEIKKKLEEKNISISGLGYYPNPLEAEKEQSDFYTSHLKKVIDGAAQLGVSVVNTFIGRDHKKDLEYNKGRFKDVWPSIIKHAEKRGVKVGIENCPMFFTQDEWPGGKNLAVSPSIWRWMFEEIDSPNFGLNYDPSHLVWQFMDYLKPLEEFKEKLIHVHLKDAKIDFDKLDDVGTLATPLEFHTPKLPGLGDIDWGEFFSKLTDIRYQGDVVVEVEDRAYEASLETRIGALRQVRNYMKQYLP
jgi:sugar phosphate isomerase/epimerase